MSSDKETVTEIRSALFESENLMDTLQEKIKSSEKEFSPCAEIDLSGKF